MKHWRTDAFVRRFCLAIAFAASLGALAYAGDDQAPPRSFSREKLERIGEYIRNEIATGKIPGAIILIQQHGKPVYYKKFGVRDVATGLPMTDDTIFTAY